VVGARVFVLRQTASDVLFRTLPLQGPGQVTLSACADDTAAAAAALRDYLALDVALAPLHAGFAAADPGRFGRLAPFVAGARVCRQPPVECFFSFLCSSNNHVARIGGMVEALARHYGSPLGSPLSDDASPAPPFHAFPTVAQLASATEAELRLLGFGYRARYVAASAALLAAKPGGGEAWLLGLRDPGLSAAECVKQLCSLPGCGPKVGACVALFALDKTDCVPVDVHVWRLALRHYSDDLPPELRLPPPAAPVAEALPPLDAPEAEPPAPPATLARLAAVESALRRRFGRYAGWAQTALFVCELRGAVRESLPAELRTPPLAKVPRPPRAAVGGKKGSVKRKLEA